MIDELKSERVTSYGGRTYRTSTDGDKMLDKQRRKESVPF